MVLYIEYSNCKKKLVEAQKSFTKILDEKEELFNITQPQGTNYDKELVDGGSRENVFDKYLEMKEIKEIDKRLDEARTILNDRKIMEKIKKEELLQSNDVKDKIYVHKFLDHLSYNQIAKSVNYSEREVYRVVKKMREETQW